MAIKIIDDQTIMISRLLIDLIQDYHSYQSNKWTTMWRREKDIRKNRNCCLAGEVMRRSVQDQRSGPKICLNHAFLRIMEEITT